MPVLLILRDKMTTKQKEKIIIIGRGKHAKVVTDIIEDMNKFEIMGFISEKNHKNNQFLGYPLLGNDDSLFELYNKDKITNIAIGIGGWENYNKVRKKIYYKVKEIGFRLPNLIHPTAIISKNVIMGEANVIFPGVIINTEAVLHNNIVIATGSTIDHETIIKNNVLISAGVTIGGNVEIGEDCLLALASKVISGLAIQAKVIIAAGAVVVKDCSESGKYFGVPAKKAI
jgi:sugar O-acyltransferase (sialic acid O-acetyltransferase NeuD family)